MALIRNNPALQPRGRASALVAEAIVEACLWHVLDNLGDTAAAATVVAAAADLASTPDLVRLVRLAAIDTARIIEAAGLPVAPIGSGRLHARDHGGRVGRRVSGLASTVRAAVEAAAVGPDLPIQAPRAAVEALTAARRDRALWLAAHPHWAWAIGQISQITADPSDSRSAVTAIRRALQLDAYVEPPALDLTMQPERILRLLGACDEAVAWASQFGSAEEAWRACDRADWLRWYLDATRTGVPLELGDADAETIRRQFPTPPPVRASEA